MQHELLKSLPREFGTPLYVYDADRITEQFKKLKTAFENYPTRFFYACKALSNVNILRHMHHIGTQLDCVSIHEVKLGLLAGFQPKQILFTPNGVDFNEITEAKELGVHINIDSISMLEQFGAEFASSYPICLRLNPHIMAGGNNKISTGHIDSKFGISIHQLRHIERIVNTTGIRVEGLHMHTGSEIKDVEVFLMGLDVILDVAKRFTSVDYVDMGSGFKVAYKPGEKETDIDLLGQKVMERMKEFENETGRRPELWFEPGKYLVSQCGYFLVKANVVKQTPATVFVGVNSGFNHLIRPMMYDAYHHIENISNPEGTPRIYTVVGNICETDTFAWDRTLTEVREGDILVMYNAGAYGFEMSSQFNARLRPAEVMVEGGKTRLIRQRETFEDLLKNQVI
jgi:diaminopimelate decarboxylase